MNGGRPAVSRIAAQLQHRRKYIDGESSTSRCLDNFVVVCGELLEADQ